MSEYSAPYPDDLLRQQQDEIARLKQQLAEHQGARMRDQPNRFIYHYCASVQEIIGQVTYISGVAQVVNPIVDMKDFGRLRELVADGQDIPLEKLVILSLSLLGREQDLIAKRAEERE
jgi:hypothetical protein